jgi:hypothetical protein
MQSAQGRLDSIHKRAPPRCDSHRATPGGWGGIHTERRQVRGLLVTNAKGRVMSKALIISRRG